MPKTKTATPLTELLKNELSRMNLSGRRAALKAGISPSYMALILAGGGPPSSDVLVKISRGLGIPLRQLEEASFATQRVTRVVSGTSKLHALVDRAEDELSRRDLEDVAMILETAVAAKMRRGRG